MLPSQRATLDDSERDMLMSAIISKSPRQVATTVLQIDSIKDEIIVNLMGYLLNHFKARESINEDNIVDCQLPSDEFDVASNLNDVGNCSYLSKSNSPSNGIHGLSPTRNVLPARERGGAAFQLAAPVRAVTSRRSSKAYTAADRTSPHSGTAGWTLPPHEALVCVPVMAAIDQGAASSSVSSAITLPAVIKLEEPSCSMVLPQREELHGHSSHSPGDPTRTTFDSPASKQTSAVRESPSNSSLSAVAAATAAAAAGRPGYTCAECGRHFKNSEALKFHAAKHLGMAYQCPLCKQCLKSSNSYSNHMKMHSGYNGHRCALCLKHFMRRHELVRHVKIVHIGERPYACTECGAAFATEWNMVRHRKAMHVSSPATVTPCSVQSSLRAPTT